MNEDTHPMDIMFFVMIGFFAGFILCGAIFGCPHRTFKQSLTEFLK